MCVIIYKPAGVEMPSDEILNAAYKANPHGCGFVSPALFYKGMNYPAFKKALRCVGKESPCIIHFRFATHGSIGAKNCHPFRRGNVYFAHNGILSIKPKGDMTDSETAFQNIIYPAIRKYGFGSVVADEIINDVRGYSKFAFMIDNEVSLYGDFEPLDGCYYSNLRFYNYRSFHNFV